MNTRTSMLAALLTVPLLAAFVIPHAAAGSCDFTAPLTATIADANPVKVVVAAGSGNLVVTGEASRHSVQASGRACASSQELLDQIRIDTRRDGDTVYITTIIPDSREGLLLRREASLDLTVLIPASAAVDLQDSSGDVRVRGTSSAVIADGSGDLDVKDVHGDVLLSDSSGDLRIAQVSGNVQVTDSSADIDIADVTGSVDIPVDSAGDILLQRIAGNVHIARDSSGDIVIRDVQRDVAIGSDSSGNISVDRVTGNFTVGADSSGDILSNRVLGKVDIPSPSR